jgi:hypothetical protein
MLIHVSLWYKLPSVQNDFKLHFTPITVLTLMNIHDTDGTVSLDSYDFNWDSLFSLISYLVI